MARVSLGRGQHVKAARSTWLLAAALTLSGCTSLFVSTPPPLDTYELTAPSVAGRSGSSHRQILIAEPSALKSLDGQSMVINPTPGSIQFLKGAQWSDRLRARRDIPARRRLHRRRQARRGAGDRLSGDRRDPQFRHQARWHRPCRGRAFRQAAQRPQWPGSRIARLHGKRACFARRQRCLCRGPRCRLRHVRHRHRQVDGITHLT